MVTVLKKKKSFNKTSLSFWQLPSMQAKFSHQRSRAIRSNNYFNKRYNLQWVTGARRKLKLSKLKNALLNGVMANQTQRTLFLPWSPRCNLWAAAEDCCTVRHGDIGFVSMLRFNSFSPSLPSCGLCHMHWIQPPSGEQGWCTERCSVRFWHH